MKKDLKPIWLYILLYFGTQILIGIIYGVIYGANATEMINNKVGFITFASYFVTATVFLIIYRKELLEKIKKLTKRDILFIIGASIIVILANEVASRIMVNAGVEMQNQDSIIEAYKNSKVLMALSIAIFAPFIEEMVFRYSFSTFIKNDTLFVIISSLIFGILHGIGIVTILYVGLGALLAIIYLKTDKNIISSTIAHILNNTFAIITMIILFK